MLNETEFLILNTILKKGEARPVDIKKDCDLSEPTIHGYLNKFHDDVKYLRKKSRPNKAIKSAHNTYYFINVSVFIKFAKEYIDTPHWHIFHSSTYCQKMITPSLLREIEKIQDTEPFPSKLLIDNPDVFTEEDVLEILRLSPTALKKSLQDPLEDSSSERFNEMLLAAFILDVNTRFYRGCTFKVEMSLEFPRPGKEPFFKRSKSSVFSIMADEY